MVVAFYFRLHLAYFPRPVVAIFARPEHYHALSFYFCFRGEAGSIDTFPLAPEQESFDTSYTPKYPDGKDAPC